MEIMLIHMEFLEKITSCIEKNNISYQKGQYPISVSAHHSPIPYPLHST